MDLVEMDETYRKPFEDFCASFDNSVLEEERGKAANGSPYHLMSCRIRDPSDMQVSILHTGERKEIDFVNYAWRKEHIMKVVRDDGMTGASLSAEPADRVYISRDFETPEITQSHMISGHYKKVELTFHGGTYGRMYSVELR